VRVVNLAALAQACAQPTLAFLPKAPTVAVLRLCDRHAAENPFSDAPSAEVGLGLYPIVTFQYSSTTLYQVSYHIQYLFF
jgi:hypothetical protein